MGIREDIRRAIHNKLILRILGPKGDKEVCVICNKSFNGANSLCVHIINDGNMCDSCSEIYAPDLLNAKKLCLSETD
ncbi:hypothetical protein CHISP_0142 [Chitinispirillum alkaliphilum]|nr:hypothetical protein CHISP_0142 [Chitinispirillum alkaliphilum]